MKHHLIFYHIHPSREHHWFTDHANTVSFVAACLAAGLLMWALVTIRTYIEPAI